METLKNQCKLSNPKLGENLRIDFDLRMEGKVKELWSASPTAGKIKAHVYFYGDDGHKGDNLLHTFEYGIKLSHHGGAIQEEKAIIPFQSDGVSSEDGFILDEDKHGKDEVYAIFYLTMTFETVEGLEVDAVISDLVKTNTLRKELKR